LRARSNKKSLDRIEAAIDEIAEKQVVGVGTLAAHLEQFFQVIKLTVDIATDSHRTINALNIAFFHQDFHRLLT